MFEFKISGETFTMPQYASEMTLGQFIKLRNARQMDELERLAVILNCEPEKLSSLKYTPKTSIEIGNVMKLTSHMNEDMKRFFASPEKFVTPKQVFILGKIIRIPQDLEKEPFWPSRKVKEIIQERVMATGRGEEFDPTDRIADVIAHYLYVPFTEMKYNEIRAEEFKAAVYDLPLTVAVPLGNFFFLKWKELYLTSLGCFLTSLLIWKKRLALRCSKFTGTSTRLRR